MSTNEEKEALCLEHFDLLYLIYRYGNGAMLLPQLRTLAVVLGMYSSHHAVGRAVRALRDAGILNAPLGLMDVATC